MKTIVGVAGRARSGKDTIGDFLAEQYGFERISFAGPLKEMLRVGFGLTESHISGDLKDAPLPWLDGKSPRQLMQTIGTEWGREMVHSDVWLILARRAIEAIPGPVVITDVRFENEADMIRDVGGSLVHVVRPDLEKVAEHKSEAGVSYRPSDFRIYNSGSLEDLYRTIDVFVADVGIDVFA